MHTRTRTRTHTDTGTHTHTQAGTPSQVHTGIQTGTLPWCSREAGSVGLGPGSSLGGFRWSRPPALSSVPCHPPLPLTLAHLRSLGNGAVCPRSLHITGADQGLGEVSQETWMGKSFLGALARVPRRDSSAAAPRPLAALLSGLSSPSSAGTAEPRGLLEAGRGGSRTQERMRAEPRPRGRREIEVGLLGIG